MKKLLLAAIIASAGLAGTTASAAVIGFTEGTRDRVEGTTRLSPKDTSSNPANAFDLSTTGSLGLDSFQIYGRIVDAVDTFAFGFSSGSDFQVSWIFGGYNLHEGSTPVADSGFVSEVADAEKTATFSLLDADNGFAVLQSMSFSTDITAGPESIFSTGAGNYVLKIDGSGPINSPGRGVGLYDIEISAVPLPASAFLLLAGVAGLGAVSRRKKS